jgi:hypothetical protein
MVDARRLVEVSIVRAEETDDSWPLKRTLTLHLQESASYFVAARLATVLRQLPTDAYMLALCHGHVISGHFLKPSHHKELVVR